MLLQYLKSTTLWQPPLQRTALWSVQSTKQNEAGYCNSEKLFDNVHPVATQRSSDTYCCVVNGRIFKCQLLYTKLNISPSDMHHIFV
jgi:hypothetical protein